MRDEEGGGGRGGGVREKGRGQVGKEGEEWKRVVVGGDKKRRREGRRGQEK